MRLALLYILVGLNLMDVLKLPFSTKPLIQRLAKAYGLSLAGLFFLGFLFVLIKASCATPLLLVILSKLIIRFNVGLLLTNSLRLWSNIAIHRHRSS